MNSVELRSIPFRVHGIQAPVTAAVCFSNKVVVYNCSLTEKVVCIGLPLGALHEPLVDNKRSAMRCCVVTRASNV